MSVRLVLVVLLLQVMTVRAQLAYNTNILPLGDKEALMGNTGTGGMGSTGAVFYNPAALMQLEGSSFSLSGSAYMAYSFEATPFTVIDDDRLDYKGSGFQSVPTSLVMARTLGNWRVAFSLLVPSQFKYEGQQDWAFDLDGARYQLKILQNYSESMFLGGLSAAHRINERWSWGVSVHGQYFSYLSASDVRISSVDDPTRTAISTTRDQRAPISAYVLGGLHRQGDKLGLGLRVALPSIRIRGKGEHYAYEYLALLGTTPPTVQETDLTGLKADFETPFDVRLGATYRSGERLKLAMDASYGSGVAYDVVSGQGYSEREELESTFRLSAGAEVAVQKQRALLVGLSWAPSTTTSAGISNTITFLSYTAGVKLTLGRSETTVGYFGALGDGALPYVEGTIPAEQVYRYNGAFLGTSVTL
jgi:long-subunit fatty acid transport protein